MYRERSYTQKYKFDKTNRLVHKRLKTLIVMLAENLNKMCIHFDSWSYGGRFQVVSSKTKNGDNIREERPMRRDKSKPVTSGEWYLSAPHSLTSVLYLLFRAVRSVPSLKDDKFLIKNMLGAVERILTLIESNKG